MNNSIEIQNEQNLISLTENITAPPNGDSATGTASNTFSLPLQFLRERVFPGLIVKVAFERSGRPFSGECFWVQITSCYYPDGEVQFYGDLKSERLKGECGDVYVGPFEPRNIIDIEMDLAVYKAIWEEDFYP